MPLAATRILITGGAGFVGSHVVEELERVGCRNLFIPRSKEYDLTHPEAVTRLYDDARPQLVIHLVATVGGIGAIARTLGASSTRTS